MSAQHPIRVLTVDDHPLLRGGISGAIMAQPDMTVVAEATDGEEAVDMLSDPPAGHNAHGSAHA